MVCAYCQSKTEIVNSRHLSRVNATWRRRHCLKCQALLTTLEKADYSRLWLISDGQNGPFKPFLRDKLFLSLHDCLKHRKTALNDASALTDTVIAKLTKKTTGSQVAKPLLLHTVLETLKRFDKTAAVHYQAYYIDS